MSKNRYINTHFWTDGYIEELDPSEKLIFLYLLTNPLTSIGGVYEISIKRIAYDTGFDKDMVLKILKRFEKDSKVYYIHSFIIIINSIKHQSLNVNIKKGIEANLNNIPNIVKASKGFQRLSKALKYLNLNLNLNFNLNSNSNKKEEKEEEKEEITLSPTLSEIESLFDKALDNLREKYKGKFDYALNGEKFDIEIVKLYEWGNNNNWTRKEGKKKVPIKNLQLTITNWIIREMNNLKLKDWEKK